MNKFIKKAHWNIRRGFIKKSLWERTMREIKRRIDEIGKVYDEVAEEMVNATPGSPEHKRYCRIERRLNTEDRLYRSSLAAYERVKVV